MPLLSLKPNHKPVAAYYAALKKFEQVGVKHETAVRSAFQTLLDHCAKQCRRVLVPEYRLKRKGGKPVIADGAIVDQFTRVLSYGLWEAKEQKDTPLDWRVEAMKLTKEGDAVIYNDHFTLAGIPPETHEYRLGNLYVSGPEPMVESVDETLKKIRVPEERIKNDFFPGYEWP